MNKKNDPLDIFEKVEENYRYGFTTHIDIEEFPKGLNEDIIRLLSQKKNEPDWLLQYRLKAYAYWKTLKEPSWQYFSMPKVHHQGASHCAQLECLCHP